MISPEENKQVTVEVLRDRIFKKENLIKFTEMEVEEIKRTIMTLEKV